MVNISTHRKNLSKSMSGKDMGIPVDMICKSGKCINKLPVLFSFIFNLKLFHVSLIILNYCFFFPWLKFK